MIENAVDKAVLNFSELFATKSSMTVKLALVMNKGVVKVSFEEQKKSLKWLKINLILQKSP